MMPLLVLLVAVHPASLEVAAAPGEIIELPLLLVGDEPVRVEASGILSAETHAQLAGAEQLSLETRVSPHARPGLHLEHVYVTPAAHGPLVTAQATKVLIEVTDGPQEYRVLAGTADTLTGKPWMLIGAAVLAALLLSLLVSVRVSRRGSAARSPKGSL